MAIAADAREGSQDAIAAEKFSVPPLPSTYVDRTRLGPVLLAAESRRLTIVTGGVGAGKTTLLAGYARSRARGSLAWCTLDESDADPHAFGVSLVRAMLAARARDGLGHLASVRSSSPDPLDQAMELAAHGSHLVLVLDNVERLSTRAARAALQRLVHLTPPNLSIVLLTRRDPEFHPHQFRGDQPGSLRAGELAFTVAETTTLFARYGVVVADDEVETLAAWTEGSASALHLVALCLRDGAGAPLLEEARLAERTVVDFLLNTVLALQPSGLREFLLRTAIVDTINADLASAIVPGDDAAPLLDAAAREQLLIMPVAGADGWYCHHSLTADLLRARLRHDLPDEVPVLHARAAQWFETAGLVDDAMRHAAAGGEWSVVARMIVDTWVTSMIGGVRAPARVAAYPLPAAEGDDVLYALATAIQALEHGETKRAVSALDNAAKLGDGDASLRLVAALLRMKIACEDLESAHAIDDAADDVLAASTDGCASDHQRERLAILALGARAAARIREGDLDAATRLLECVVESVPFDRDAVTATATATLALTEVLRGRLRRGVALTEEIGEIWADAAAPQVRGLRGLTLAICAYHADDLAGARAALGEAREHLGPGVFRDVVFPAVAARVARADGDRDATRRLLTPLLASSCGPLLDILGDALGLAELSAKAASATHPPGTHPYAIVQGHLATAVDAAARHDHEASEDAIRRALAIVDQHGYRRAFVDCGLPLRELLVDYVSDVRPFRMLATQLLERMWVEGELNASALVERLTERELTVLRYLPTMMSNSEIAGEMYFSVNTVKTHLKSIYRKLEVTRRREAVDRARDLSLI